MKRTSLLFKAPGEVEIVEETFDPPGEGEVHVQTALSAISSGTERLIYAGQAPTTLSADHSLSSLKGDLSYPLKYGYAAVGIVRGLGPGVERSWMDRPVFAFQPHCSDFTIHTSDLIPLPDDLPLEDAAFLPNMETAATLLHDGAPLIGERVLVLGQGVVGLLTTCLLRRIADLTVITADLLATRREYSLRAGADISINPEHEEQMAELERVLMLDSDRGGADLIYELTGNPQALNLAISSAGFGARIVIGSWYGTKRAETLDLGTALHRERLTIISSQVSTINPSLSGRWDKRRRLNLARQLLKEIQPARWVTHRFEFEQAPQAYRHLDDPQALQILLTYPSGTPSR